MGIAEALMGWIGFAVIVIGLCGFLVAGFMAMIDS
jgi:hypothetical protein